MLTVLSFHRNLDQWSSPLSGPMRFEYDGQSEQWLSTRNGIDLGDCLAKELSGLYPDIDLKFDI